MNAQQASPIRVFLIDDHRFILWGLKTLIGGEKTGMEVVGSVAGWAEALALLDQAAPDIILFDIDLIDEDGIAVISQIVEHSPAKVLALTEQHDKAVHQQAVMAGAHGVIEKRTSEDVILKAITALHNGQIWLDRETTSRIFIQYSRQQTTQAIDPEQRKISKLTDRERRIIEVTCNYPDGTAKMIAEKLHISEHTLRNHLTAIYNKLGLSNRLSLYIYAQKNRLEKG